MINNEQKQLGGGKGYSPSSKEVKEGTQGTNLEAVPELDTWRNIAYWLDSHDLFNCLSCTAQAHHPRNGTAYSGLNPPIIKGMPHSHANRTICKTIPQVWLSSQVTLVVTSRVASCQLDAKHNTITAKAFLPDLSPGSCVNIFKSPTISVH